MAIGSVHGDGFKNRSMSAKRSTALTTPIKAPPAMKPDAMSVPFSLLASLISLSLLRVFTNQAMAPPTRRGRFKSIGMNIPNANGRAGNLQSVRMMAIAAPIP